jgi:hypothetical protein
MKKFLVIIVACALMLVISGCVILGQREALTASMANATVQKLKEKCDAGDANACKVLQQKAPATVQQLSDIINGGKAGQ